MEEKDGKKITTRKPWKTRMKQMDPDSPGLAASGPNRDTEPLFEALSKTSTASFNQSKIRCEPGKRKIIRPMRSCKPTPHAIVFQAIFRRLLESNQAMPAKITKPRNDTAW